MEEGLSQGMILLFTIIAFVFHQMGKKDKEEEIRRDEYRQKEFKRKKDQYIQNERKRINNEHNLRRQKMLKEWAERIKANKLKQEEK